MDVVKAVKQSYHASPEILELLKDFRLMVNDCIQVGLKKEEQGEIITSMKKLSLACYP